MSKPQFTNKEIADLQEAYEKAIYEVYYQGETIQLSIGKHNLELDLVLKKYNCTTWAFVTAFNPYSQCLSAAENQYRNKSLIELARSQNLAFFNAVGKDKDDVWTPEQSIFIVGIELESAMPTASSAIAIGNRFQQNAIAFGELEKSAQLIWL